MKKEPIRTRSTPPPVQHQFEHELPTVVHDPEQDMTALGKLVFHVIQDPKKYSRWALGLVAAVVGLFVISQLTSRSRSSGSDVWAKVEMAKKAEDRLEIVRQNPDSPAANWVLLQSASEFYNQGLADMPNNRDVAVPLFQKAIALYEQIEKAAPKDALEVREAALGKARALEARYKLSEAIEQYQRIATTWPDTPQAKQAKQLAEILQTPEAAEFYKDLYAYSPSKVTLPPLGSEKLPLSIPRGTNVEAPFDASSILNMPIEAAPTKIREIPAGPAKTPAPKAANADLPADVFSKKAPN